MEEDTPENCFLIIQLYNENSRSVKNAFPALLPFYGQRKKPPEYAIKAIVTNDQTSFTLVDINIAVEEANLFIHS